MVLLPALFSACGGEAPAGPTGDINFAVMGDAPYYWWEEQRYDHLVDALNADSLDWVIHLGDLFWIPCSDAKMRERLEVLQRLRHPVFLTPGDNEWTDCWGRREGGFAPLERLAKLREIYYPEPGRTLGGTPMMVRSQAADSSWSEFVENVRWARGGIVFATFHLVGSRNATEAFPGRTEADDRAVARRTEAAVAWLRATFGEARASGAKAVFLAMHAAFFDRPDERAPVPGVPEAASAGESDPEGDEYRKAYEPFLSALAGEVAAFAGPVVLAHGDDHEFVVDSPLIDPATGRPFDNFTRLEVMGSPDVGWVRVAVDTAGPRFAYAPRRIPGWKIW